MCDLHQTKPKHFVLLFHFQQMSADLLETMRQLEERRSTSQVHAQRVVADMSEVSDTSTVSIHSNTANDAGPSSENITHVSGSSAGDFLSPHKSEEDSHDAAVSSSSTISLSRKRAGGSATPRHWPVSRAGESATPRHVSVSMYTGRWSVSDGASAYTAASSSELNVGYGYGIKVRHALSNPSLTSWCWNPERW